MKKSFWDRNLNKKGLFKDKRHSKNSNGKSSCKNKSKSTLKRKGSDRCKNRKNKNKSERKCSKSKNSEKTMKESSPSSKNKREKRNSNEKSKDSMRKIVKWLSKLSEDWNKTMKGTESEGRLTSCINTAKSKKSWKRPRKWGRCKIRRFKKKGRKRSCNSLPEGNSLKTSKLWEEPNNERNNKNLDTITTIMSFLNKSQNNRRLILAIETPQTISITNKRETLCPNQPTKLKPNLSLTKIKITETKMCRLKTIN